jgi:hypothetical protein
LRAYPSMVSHNFRLLRRPSIARQRRVPDFNGKVSLISLNALTIW